MTAIRDARGDREGGFTLVELLVAMVIMSVAVVVLVAAMGNVFVSASYNRGYSRLETNMRNFAEAIQQKASFSTALTAAVNDTATSIPIANPVTSFGDTRAGGSTNFPFWIVVDGETMRVTGLAGGAPKSLQVQRAQGGTIAAKHNAGAGVVQLFGCPIVGNDDSQSTDNGDYGSKAIGYIYPSGFQTTDSKIKVSIQGPVGYMDQANAQAGITPAQFDWSQSQCWDGTTATTGFSTLCPSPNLMPQCDSGVVEVTIKGTDSTGAASTSATETILVRRGSQ